MKIADLMKVFEEKACNVLDFEGNCNDCGCQVKVTAEKEGKDVHISGGAVYGTEVGVFYKCDDCFGKNKVLTNYRPVEVYSRVTGYLRPVSNWNKGKQSEFKTRKTFKIEQPLEQAR